MEILLGRPDGKMIRVWMEEDDGKIAVKAAFDNVSCRPIVTFSAKDETMLVHTDSLHDIGLKLEGTSIRDSEGIRIRRGNGKAQDT